MRKKKLSAIIVIQTIIALTVFTCLLQGCSANRSGEDAISDPGTEHETTEPAGETTRNNDDTMEEGNKASNGNISELELNLSKFALNFNKSMTVISSETSQSAASLGSFNASLASEIRPIIFITEGYDSPPKPFFDDIPSDGYINTPTGGECPLGASVMMSFTNADGKDITRKLLEEISAMVIPYEIISLPESNPDSIKSYLNSKITPGNTQLADPSYWNREIWGTEGSGGLESLQQDVRNIINYQLWTKAPEYESMIAGTMQNQINSIGVKPVMDAFNASDKTGWVGYPAATAGDQIAVKNIMAEFSGNVEGTVYESGGFTIDSSGNTSFGNMIGEGQLLLKDSKIGEVVFDTILEWTMIDERGAPLEGTVTLSNEENGYVIEIITGADGTKSGVFLVDGKEVGKVSVDISGHSTYINLESNDTAAIE